MPQGVQVQVLLCAPFFQKKLMVLVILAQFSADLEGRKMRFQKTIKHRRFQATIYGKSQKYPYYRVAYYAVGKRHIRNFKTYSLATAAAVNILRDLADGSQSVALSAMQSRDALTTLDILEAFHQATGHRISLPAAISKFVEVPKKLGERILDEAADEFLKNTAIVKPKSIDEAVAGFVEGIEVRTIASEGQR